MILINQNISRYRSNGGTLIGKIENRFLKKEPIIWQKKDIAYFFYLICRRRSQY